MGISDRHLRQEITKIVSSLIPFDLLEEEQIDFVLNWLGSGAEIFRITKPDIPDIHLVSYFILIDAKAQKLLLVDHKKAGLWLPAGGHVEIDEHPKETVKREIIEELGIEADFLFEDPLFLTVTKTVGKVALHTDVSLWYVCKGNCEEPLKYDAEEFHGIQWFSLDAIPLERADPHMRRFVAKLSQAML